MEISFNCSQCGELIQIDETCAGLVMKCVHCLASITVPGGEPAAAQENGLYESDPAVKEFCLKASEVFFAYNQAANQWKLENSLRDEKETIRALYAAKLQEVKEDALRSKITEETTNHLNRVSQDVMTAINARYDLWITAEKQSASLLEMLARLKAE